jgi:hypothetical protein
MPGMTVGRWDAPWSPEQVATLERWQSSSNVHPYTCASPVHDGRATLLTPTPAGWVCDCGFRQTWAWAVGPDHVR